MLNICLIGVSGFAAIHYEDVLRQVASGRMRLLGATIINPSEEAEKCRVLRELGCRVFSDYRAMLSALAGRVDLCVIPTGLHLHAEMTVQALRAGANVLVEKPAAATIQDVRAMQKAEVAAQRFVAVAYQNAYASETLWMKRAILDGEIGALRCVKTRCLWSRAAPYYARNEWAGRLRVARGEREVWVLDSPFHNAVAHQLNMIAFLAGTQWNRSAALESVQAELYRAQEIESPDTTALRAVTREGVRLLFLATHCPQGSLNPEIEVRGEKGRILWTGERTLIERADGSREERPSQGGQALRDAMWNAVARRVHDPDSLICDLENAAAQVLCANGAHDSSPVHPINARFVRRENHSAGLKTIIQGVDESVARAFEREQLWSELGVPWAQAGQVVRLAEYNHFPRPRAELTSLELSAEAVNKARGFACV